MSFPATLTHASRPSCICVEGFSSSLWDKSIHIESRNHSLRYLVPLPFQSNENRVKFQVMAKRKNYEKFPLSKSKKKEPNVVPELDQLTKEEMHQFFDLQLQSEVEILESTPEYRHYEVLYLIGENHLDEVPDIVEKYKGVIGQFRGTIWRLNDWGLRPLAYRIKKNDQANYILMNFEIPADKINELDFMMEKDEKVIRHLISKRKAAITKDCPSPELFFAISDEDFAEEFGDEDEDDEEGEDDDDEEEEEEEEEKKETKVTV